MKILLLNQCFRPDVVATAQQLTDLAVGLVERGHKVTVICGNRGYDDSSLRFPTRERWNDIEIIRVPAIRANKTSRLRRGLNFGSFLAACAVRLTLMPRQDVVVALTSPPLITWLASLFTRLKGGHLITWIMDLNPDEAIAAGWLKPHSATANLLARLLRDSVRRAEKVVVLDRFMRDRIAGKGISREQIRIVPPWSHDNSVSYDQRGREEFRGQHNISDKFVVMYAGNHSPCHPLDTLLQAAKKLNDRDDISFCFIGGGSEQHKVREFAYEHDLKNVLVLPYQRLEKLSASLSAADLHVVVMGSPFIGIIHPCKIYNVLAVGTPFLYLGPGESHMGDIISKLADKDVALQAQHGEVERVVQLITAAAQYPQFQNARQPPVLARQFSRRVILPQLISEIESAGHEMTAMAPQSAETNMQSA